MPAALARRALLHLPALAGWVLLSGHAPYRQWNVYRKQRLVIATNGADRIAVRLGETVVRTLASRLPESHAMLATARSVLDVIRLLRSGQLEVAVLAADDALGATAGLPEYGGAKLQLSALAVLEPSVLHLVAPREGVSGVRDLAGKTLGIGAPGARVEVVVGRVLAGFGIEQEVRLARVPVDSAAAALRERSVDAFAWLDTFPSGVVSQLARAPGLGIRLLDQEAALAKIAAEHGPIYQRTVVPADIYPGVPAPVTVAAVPHLVVGLARLDHEVAHSIAWALDAPPAAGTPLPVHPGASRAGADAVPQSADVPVQR
jgi:TRAP transporter TAXI family solute receptor